LVSFGAVATITSWCIYALSSKGAQLGATFLALVDIGTAAIRLGLIALGTGTVANTSGYGDALGSAGTGLSTGGASRQNATVANKLVWRLTLALRGIADLAHDERVSIVTLWTAALIASWQILAQSIQSTDGLSSL